MNDIKKILEEILKQITDDFSVEEIVAGGQNIIHIKSQDAKILIGQKGNTLRSINYLLRKIAQKKGIESQVLIDVNEYQLKQIKDIEEKARLLANRAKTLQYDVEMPPMSAYERLIVHASLADDKDIETQSHGEGKERRLVIKYIKN
jgi:spoIIIJ-associated protein